MSFVGYNAADFVFVRIFVNVLCKSDGKRGKKATKWLCIYIYIYINSAYRRMKPKYATVCATIAYGAVCTEL